MSVPQQIRKSTEAIQALYADLENGKPADGQETEPKVTPVEGAVQNGPGADGGGEPAVKPVPSEPGPGNQGEEDFEHKYRTIQGMFNKQVPRLEAQNRELTQRLQSLEQLVATMETAAPKRTAAPASPVQSFVSDAEREEYGESIDVMRKVSQEVAGPLQAEISRLNDVIAQLQGSVVPQVNQLAQRQTQTAEQHFWSQLSSLVPNWREVNDNQDFQTWLLEIDPLSGHSRQDFLEQAQQHLDANRVAGFFNSWQQKGTGTAPPTKTASTEIQKQVAPGRSRGTGAPQGNQQKTYTAKDVAKFYDDVRSGVYRGKEQDRNRIEADIFAAQREGRIVAA